MIEMYLADVSVRRVEDITEALWGSKVSPATIGELRKPTSILRLGATGPYRVGGIHMSMGARYICVGTGAESMKIWPFWWRSQ